MVHGKLANKTAGKFNGEYKSSHLLIHDCRITHPTSERTLSFLEHESLHFRVLTASMTYQIVTNHWIYSASGFIGFPVAQALLRAGHTVYGQTRSKDKAKQLAANESTRSYI
jgi:hypothetical protein